MSETNTANNGKKTQWTCDVCNEAFFDNYDEALEHEKHCKGSSKNGNGINAKANAAGMGVNGNANGGSKSVTETVTNGNATAAGTSGKSAGEAAAAAAVPIRKQQQIQQKSQQQQNQVYNQEQVQPVSVQQQAAQVQAQAQQAHSPPFHPRQHQQYPQHQHQHQHQHYPQHQQPNAFYPNYHMQHHPMNHHNHVHPQHPHANANANVNVPAHPQNQHQHQHHNHQQHPHQYQDYAPQQHPFMLMQQQAAQQQAAVLQDRARQVQRQSQIAHTSPAKNAGGAPRTKHANANVNVNVNQNNHKKTNRPLQTKPRHVTQQQPQVQATGQTQISTPVKSNLKAKSHSPNTSLQNQQVGITSKGDENENQGRGHGQGQGQPKLVSRKPQKHVPIDPKTLAQRHTPSTNANTSASASANSDRKRARNSNTNLNPSPVATKKTSNSAKTTTNANGNESQNKNNSHVKMDRNGNPVKTLWTCDVCRVKEFSDYDEAVEHEKTCTGVIEIDDSPVIACKRVPVINLDAADHIVKGKEKTGNRGARGYAARTLELERLKNKVRMKNSNNRSTPLAVPDGKTMPVGTKTSASTASRLLPKVHNPVQSPSIPLSTELVKDDDDPEPIDPTLSIKLLPPISEKQLPRGSNVPLVGNCFACDVCKEQYFRDYKTAVIHEDLCKEKVKREADLKAYNDLKEKYKRDLETWKERRNKRKKARELSFGTNNGTVNRDSNLTVSPLLGRKSKGENREDKNVDKGVEVIVLDNEDDSDVGSVASTSDQVAATSSINTTPTPGATGGQFTFSKLNSAETKKRKSPKRKRDIFSPMCSRSNLGDDDFDTNYTNLSGFYQYLLSYVDLDPNFLLKGKDGDKPRCVGFRCHFCKKTLALPQKQNWTKKAVCTILPDIAKKHFKDCNSITLEVHKNMYSKVILGERENGQVTFEDFFEMFCKKHSVHEMITDGIPDGLYFAGGWSSPGPGEASAGQNNPSKENSTLDDDDSQNDEKKSSARRTILSEPPSRTKASARTFKAHDAQIMYSYIVESLKKLRHKAFCASVVFPIISGATLPLLKYISPYDRLTLSQLNFMIPKEIREDGFCPVSIKCKHCGASVALTHLKDWDKTVVTFSILHLGDTCTHIPSSVRTDLKELQEESKKLKEESKSLSGTPSNPFLTLQQICDCVAIYYNFIERVESGVKGVFVKFLQDAKGITCRKRKLIEGDSATNREATNEKPLCQKNNAETNESSEQLPRPRPASPLEAKKRKLSMDEEAALPALIPHSTTHLVPFGGVPLLSSITRKKAASLKRSQKKLLEQLEFCFGESLTKLGRRQVFLRCQNCNSVPGESWKEPLQATRDLYRQIMMAYSHYETCKCTPESLKDEIRRVHDTFITSRSNPMTTYCDFLASVYGLKDVVISENNRKECFVIYSDCEYDLEENYTSKNFDLTKRITRQQRTNE